MSKLEQARKTWVGKSDEWLYERLANELSDKVEEIHRLIKELDEVKKLTISDVIKQVYCECENQTEYTDVNGIIYCKWCGKYIKQ